MSKDKIKMPTKIKYLQTLGKAAKTHKLNHANEIT
jgi:hypothetical protein